MSYHTNGIVMARSTLAIEKATLRQKNYSPDSQMETEKFARIFGYTASESVPIRSMYSSTTTPCGKTTIEYFPKCNPKC
jgi:hypothetical protein